MKLGVFDSGVGGLVIAKAIREHLPDHDMMYFGDTLHLPYGNRSADAIYEYTRRSIDFMFSEGCALIIVACNTASATALRRLQQEYLPHSEYADRRILGVVVPTLEIAIERGYKKLGLIGTKYTIDSNIYEDELRKIDEEITLLQKETPLLVPLIENGGEHWLVSVLEYYLSDMSVQCLILGCTHYSFLKDNIQKIMGEEVKLISQDEIIPLKLEDYLERHPEIDTKIARDGASVFYVSDLTSSYVRAAEKIYKQKLMFSRVVYDLQDDCYKRNG